MRDYFMLDYEEDYNMKDISSKLSCENMSLLSKGYTEYRNRNFVDKIQMERCIFNNNYHNDIYNIKTNESELNKGFTVNKKSCIYKRPVFDEGEWVNQYDISNTYKNGMNSGNLFNYQSKAKTNINSNYNDQCKGNGEDFSYLGECKKGPIATYTQTFTNSYDNCI